MNVDNNVQVLRRRRPSVDLVSLLDFGGSIARHELCGVAAKPGLQLVVLRRLGDHRPNEDYRVGGGRVLAVLKRSSAASVT